MNPGSQGRESLLRRLLGALGAAPSRKAAALRVWTPAVAAFIVLAALCCVSPARADNVPAPTTPASTTPDAPPPDPYHPPTSQPKPKQARPAVVHSAPVHSAPVRTYTPPVPVSPVSSAQPRHTVRPPPAKAVHKRKARPVHRQVAKPKPVKVTFNPFANFVAASNVLSTTEDTSDSDRYLWLAGFAFALLALAGLSLQLLAVRTADR
jgi:hypothetical protein